MGKRIDDLQKLDDTPIVARQVEALGDLRDQPWYQFVGEIDELLDDDRYGFAYSTLYGIKETVEKTRRVTEGQQRAVRNIAASDVSPRRWNTGFRGRLR